MKRKYVRAKVLSICPHSWTNGSYYKEEDVYASSEENAIRLIDKYHADGFGSHVVEDIWEIPKEEFRGQHKTKVLKGEEDEAD